MMILSVNIQGLTYVNDIKSYWSNEDYVELLQLFDFQDAQELSPEELREVLFMAITDFEPEEAAEIILKYKLSDQLTDGQIQAISHEMKDDKVAEEYPEPELHYDLFNINQLLYKAFNGIFPNTEASIISLKVVDNKAGKIDMTEEIMTKLISHGLVDKCLLKRLYGDQIEGKKPFKDAAKFIWSLHEKEDHVYQLITSRYWIEKEDISQRDYECAIAFYED